ncbi:unnamed protein product [Rodentolepis nana]|uniref:Uncharacterized protein n=1 Tax=Rodentolepis nana TaxID=102285 RepID=A0A0R3TIC9_RODNA|nr:unnamed protein product [Rodentolepis nana]
MRLSRARLSIGETCGHSTFKYTFHKRLSCIPIHKGIVCSLVEGVIETEGLIFQILGQIHFSFGFMYKDLLFIGYSDHVDLFTGEFFLIHWSFSNTYANLMSFNFIRTSKGSIIQSILELSNHHKEFVTRTVRINIGLFTSSALCSSALLTPLLNSFNLLYNVGFANWYTCCRGYLIVDSC